MNRRTLLKGAAGLLGSAFLPPFLRPAGASKWAAISGVAPTHQFIVEQALSMLAADPLWPTFNLPSADEITAQDYVLLDPFEGKPTGTGPDAPGNSPYSWHYFNPDTREGEAPIWVGAFFDLMVHDRVSGSDQSKGAAWAAHFLADMFVPYHTLGMPAGEMDDWPRDRRLILSPEICGDPDLMYSPDEMPPAGWGLEHDHTATIQRFRSLNPPGNAGDVDWFDPWYWNGYTEGPVGDATGSHQAWEYRAHQALLRRGLTVNRDLIRDEPFYDPLWLNFKPLLQEEFWLNQKEAAETFAEDCALRTRMSTLQLMADPTRGIAMAIRGVATLYRASMSSLALACHWEPRPEGGYKIVGTLHNRSPQASVDDMEVRLCYRAQGGDLQESIHPLIGSLGPGAVHEVSWDVPRGEPRIGWIDVAGVYHGIPDLGYAKANFSSPGVEERQPEPEQPAQEPVDPEVLRTWQGEWYTSWRDRALGPDGSWEPGNVVSVQVDGVAAVVRNDNGEFISTTVTQGGRCIEWDPPSDQSGYVRMRACLEPGGNSFTGSFGGLSYGRQINFDGRGTRKSR